MKNMIYNKPKMEVSLYYIENNFCTSSPIVPTDPTSGGVGVDNDASFAPITEAISK